MDSSIQRIRRLSPSDYRVMPWKNGCGTTTEIAVDPPGAGIDAFAWRLSVADLAASGPFSSFPGYDRIIIQTEGEPMSLVHADRGRHRLDLLSPYRFEGEWLTWGELAAPPVRDFNVMTRRDRLRADATVHRLARGGAVRLSSTAATRIVYALRGAIAIRGAAPGTALELGAEETLLLAGDPGATRGIDLEIRAAEVEAVVFVVELDPRPAGR